MTTRIQGPPPAVALPEFDYTMRCRNKLAADLPPVTSKTLDRMAAYHGNPDRPYAPGNVRPWMAARAPPLEVFPFQVCLMDLHAYRNCHFDPDMTPHYSCFSFPVIGRWHVEVRTDKPDTCFNNSSHDKTSQKGSATHSNGRTRMPKSASMALAVQRSMGFQPTAGLGNTHLRNSVPVGRFSRFRVPAGTLAGMLDNASDTYKLDMRSYPAVRRHARIDQGMYFHTGNVTFPGVHDPVDMMGRVYDVVTPYENWLRTQTPAQLAQLQPQKKVVNYKRSNSHPRLKDLNRADYAATRGGKKHVKAAQDMAKRLVKAFKTQLPLMLAAERKKALED